MIKLQLEEQFSDYNQAILSRYDYERLQLEKQKFNKTRSRQSKNRNVFQLNPKK